MLLAKAVIHSEKKKRRLNTSGWRGGWGDMDNIKSLITSNTFRSLVGGYYHPQWKWNFSNSCQDGTKNPVVWAMLKMISPPRCLHGSCNSKYVVFIHGIFPLSLCRFEGIRTSWDIMWNLWFHADSCSHLQIVLKHQTDHWGCHLSRWTCLLSSALSFFYLSWQEVLKVSF